MIQTLRNEELATLAKVLNERRTRALDVVATGKSLFAHDGYIAISGVEPILSEGGVTDANGLYLPTGVGDEGIASKLNIPIGYLRRLREIHLNLYDENVNGWLERSEERYLLRLLQATEPGESGVLRAFLSDSYKTIDDFDVLLAALQGLQSAGVADATISADLTERRMYVRVTSEKIAVQAQELLRHYRDPHDRDRTGRDYPMVFAGLVITNSEVGQGALNIVPRVVYQVCSNGQTFTKDAMRKVHLGSKLDEGVINWSAQTLRRNLALITSQTADAVAQFMSPDYVQAKVDQLSHLAGVEITEPQVAIADVSKRLGFSQDQASAILGNFIKGGDATAGGIMQAITATAQDLSDGDAAYDMEAAALDGLVFASTGR